MVGNIDTHDGQDGFSAAEPQSTSGSGRDRRSCPERNIVLRDDGPGDFVDQRCAADKASLAAWTREFRRISRRTDLAGATIDVDGPLLFQRPIPFSRGENKRIRGDVPGMFG